MSKRVKKVKDATIMELREVAYEVLSGGKEEIYDTGAQRDSDEAKTRYDLISPLFLKRLAGHLAKGAAHYGEGNWEKGIPTARSYASMFRHMMQWYEGEDTEDHLSAIVANVMFIMWVEEKIKSGDLPAELDNKGGR